MATILAMLNRFRALNLEAIAAEVAEGTEQDLITLNQNQLFMGQDADGKPLPRYHSFKNARVKNAMNPLPGLGIPDYKLTGEMYRQMFVDFDSNGKYIIKSAVPYFGKLTARGGNPFGVQPNNKEVYTRNVFNGKFVQIVSRQTGVKVV